METRKIIITGKFDAEDDKDAELGPHGVGEAMVGLGIFDIDIQTADDED